MCVSNSPLPELAKTRQGRRGRWCAPAPVWKQMDALAVSTLAERFAQRTEPPGSYDQSSGVYANFRMGEYGLRLQAVTWPAATLMDRELRLLLLLSPMANSYLPIGSELTVAEDNLRHSGQTLCWASNPTCLYTQGLGDWEKQFSVRVSLPNTGLLVLPSLTFSKSLS